MTVQQRLDAVGALIKNNKWELADKQIDGIYEDYTSNRITPTEDEEMYMFTLIDDISAHFYDTRK